MDFFWNALFKIECNFSFVFLAPCHFSISFSMLQVPSWKLTRCLGTSKLLCLQQVQILDGMLVFAGIFLWGEGAGFFNYFIIGRKSTSSAMMPRCISQDMRWKSDCSAQLVRIFTVELHKTRIDEHWPPRKQRSVQPKTFLRQLHAGPWTNIFSPQTHQYARNLCCVRKNMLEIFVSFRTY